MTERTNDEEEPTIESDEKKSTIENSEREPIIENGEEESIIDHEANDPDGESAGNGTYQQLYSETIPSVVSVYVTPRTVAEGARTGAGSGFVYDADHVVTNDHVVGASDDVELRFSEGDWRTGRVVGRDVYTDLAVVAVADLPEYAAPLPVATTTPIPGQRVAALGNPMGLDGTITAGVVSGVNRSVVTGGRFVVPDTVQTDAAINPGNSGGPLVTMAGEVVGVNRAKQGENIGFAISAAIVSRVVPDLVETGDYRHSYLKISTIDVSPIVAEANDLLDDGVPETGGVLVVDVRLGPASGALRGCSGSRTVRGREIPVGGDVIVGVDGREVRSHEELTRYLITETRPGERVSVELVRDGRRVSETLTLGERPRPRSSGPVGIAID